MKATQNCSIEGCETRSRTRGWCVKHYNRWLKHEDPLWETPARFCEAGDCERRHYCRGYCVMHYERLRVHGTPDAPGRPIVGTTCDAPGCTEPPRQGRYCGPHRARLSRLGRFDLPEPSSRHSHSMGYQVIKRPDHPLAPARGWVYEHRVVLFDAIGPGWHPCHHCGLPVSWELTYPEHPDALVVDHLDEDRANNDVSNLAPSCAPCNFQRSSRWVKRQRRERSA